MVHSSIDRRLRAVLSNSIAAVSQQFPNAAKCDSRAQRAISPTDREQVARRLPRELQAAGNDRLSIHRAIVAVCRSLVAAKHKLHRPDRAVHDRQVVAIDESSGCIQWLETKKQY